MEKTTLFFALGEEAQPQIAKRLCRVDGVHQPRRLDESVRIQKVVTNTHETISHNEQKFVALFP